MLHTGVSVVVVRPFVLVPGVVAVPGRGPGMM
jgi:hypothetical protein